MRPYVRKRRSEAMFRRDINGRAAGVQFFRYPTGTSGLEGIA
jgi:hypothetical protein